MNVKDFIKEVKSGNIDIVENTHKILDEAIAELVELNGRKKWLPNRTWYRFLANLFIDTEAVEIKNGRPTANVNHRLMRDIGERVRTNGGPQKVVVVVKFKNEVLSH